MARVFTAFCMTLCAAAFAQPPASDVIRQANILDLEGKGADARRLLQNALESATAPAAKANVNRTIAMSWAFEGNCAKTAQYEQMVIDYWVTREKDDPHNALLSGRRDGR